MLSSTLTSPFPLYFLETYSQCHLSDFRPNASSFPFSGQIVEVLPSSTLRMVSSILIGGCPCVDPFDEILAVLYSFLDFSLISVCLMMSASNIPKYLLFFPFLQEVWFFLDLVVQFLPKFVSFRFLLLTWQHFSLPYSIPIS